MSEQLVEALVLVERAVGAIGRPLAAVQQRVHHHVRVFRPRHPGQGEQLLLLRPELGQVRAPLHGLERHVDADGLQVGLHHRGHRHRRLHPRSRLRHPHGGREAVRVAGLGQELPGALRIVGIGLERRLRSPGSRQHGPAGGRARALEHIPHDGVLVHRVVQRLADALVVEGLLLVVDPEVPDMRAHLLEEVHLRISLELGDEIGRHAHDQVDGAGEQLREPRLVLDDRAVDDAIDLDRPAPVVGVLLQRDLLAPLPARIAEGTRAHRIERVVGAPLPDGGGAHDGGGARGEDGEERGARLLEHEAHRRVVHHLDGLDVAEEVVRERVLPELVRRVLGVELALDGELHGLGVERRPVVELDALAQLERVPEAVLRDGPGLGQPGDDLRALLREGDQRLHDAARDAQRVEVRHLRRIEVDRLGDEPDDERARRLGGGRGRRGRDREESDEQQDES